MQEFRHHNFEIGLPPRWVDRSTVILLGPPSGGYSPSITITQESLDFEFTAEEYGANQLAALKQEFESDGYRVTREGVTALGGIGAYERFHKLMLGDSGITVEQWQVYVVLGKQAVTITCSDSTENFDRTYQLFVDAVKEFGFLAGVSD